MLRRCATLRRKSGSSSASVFDLLEIELSSCQKKKSSGNGKL